MNLLLDTHVLLWSLGSPERLSARTRALLVDPDNVIFASVVSAWEIEIKRALGKLRAPSDLADQLERRRFTELPVHLRHVDALAELPPLHADPFDRMLVAQARCDHLAIVSGDAKVRGYPVKVLAP